MTVRVYVRGPQILPGSWEYGIAERIVEATATSFNMTSRWNGTLIEELTHNLAGTVDHSVGTLTLSPALVFDPIRRIYEGGPFTRDELSAAAHAVAYAAHEAAHTCSEMGAFETKSGEHVPVTDDVAKAEHHVASEMYADIVGHGTTDVIRALDLDRHAPDLVGVPTVVSYPVYYLAGLALTKRLMDWSGRKPRDVIGTMSGASIGARFDVMADMVIDARIGDLDHGDRYEMRRELRLPVQRALREVHSISADENVGWDDKLQKAPDLVQVAADQVDQAIERHTSTGAVAPPDPALARLRAALDAERRPVTAGTSAAATDRRHTPPAGRNPGLDRS
jgi:hypothetical protein